MNSAYRLWNKLFSVALVVVGLCVLGESTHVRADATTERMEFSANNIATFLKSYNETSIAVAFSGPASFKGSGDRALEQMLSEALEKKRIRVVPRAKYAVKGEYKPTPFGEGIGLSVSLYIVDRFEKRMLETDLGFYLDSEKDLARLIGLSSSLAGAKDADQRRKKLRKGFEDPAIALASSRARAERNSPFAVEILINKRPRRLVEKNGLAFFNVDLNEEYVVRLINDSNHEVAVQVFVDGLSVFHFSEIRATEGHRKGEPKYRYYILDPRSHVDLVGWFKNTQKASAFRIAPIEDSLAAALGRTQDVGMITALFHACWKKGERPPAGEPANPKIRAIQRMVVENRLVKDANGKEIVLELPKMVAKMVSTVGTTFGSDRIAPTRGVARTIGVIRSTVTLRYVKED